MSTWTAAFSIFGVVALTLWLARLAAVRGRVVAVPAALLLTVIGVVSNYRYELTFPALPLTLLALALLPVSDLEHRAAGRRAKWLLGSAYGVGFGAVLVANRMLVSDVCDGGGCYSGVSLALGPTMFRTFAINVVSSIPGTGREEVLALLRSESVPTDGALDTDPLVGPDGSGPVGDARTRMAWRWPSPDGVRRTGGDAGAGCGVRDGCRPSGGGRARRCGDHVAVRAGAEADARDRPLLTATRWSPGPG